MLSNRFRKRLELCTCRKCRKHSSRDEAGRIRHGSYVHPRTARRHKESDLVAYQLVQDQEDARFRGSLLWAGTSDVAASHITMNQPPPQAEETVFGPFSGSPGLEEETVEAEDIDVGSDGAYNELEEEPLVSIF